MVGCKSLELSKLGQVLLHFLIKLLKWIFQFRCWSKCTPIVFHDDTRSNSVLMIFILINFGSSWLFPFYNRLLEKRIVLVLISLNSIWLSVDQVCNFDKCVLHLVWFEDGQNYCDLNLLSTKSDLVLILVELQKILFIASLIFFHRFVYIADGLIGNSVSIAVD